MVAAASASMLGEVVSLQPEELHEVKHEVGEAKADLESMVKTEAEEVEELKHVKDAISNVAEATVITAAKTASDEEGKAIEHEDAQQKDALSALKRVRSALDFAKPHKQQLGETKDAVVVSTL